MLVKCVAVPRERTAKKVEVILSRVSPAKKNVIKLNARIVEPVIDEYEEIFAPDILDDKEADDNLEGIVPIEEYCTEESSENEIEYTDADDEAGAEEIFNSFIEAEKIDELPSISDINADFEELENDLRNQLGDISEIEPISEHIDDSIVQRHFVRDDDGALYESDSEDAEGHEVACYDNLGKLKRACGVIKKGQPIIPNEPDVDDVYSRAVADMFPDINA